MTLYLIYKKHWYYWYYSIINIDSDYIIIMWVNVKASDPLPRNIIYLPKIPLCVWSFPIFQIKMLYARELPSVMCYKDKFSG